MLSRRRIEAGSSLCARELDSAIACRYFFGWIWSYATYEVGVQLVTGPPIAEAAAGRPENSPTPNDRVIKGAAP